MFGVFLKTLLGAAATTYLKDLIVRPKQVAQFARSYADRVGKPLLNIGAGVPAQSLSALVVGPRLWGDVNLDKAAPRSTPHGPKTVSYGDAYDLREWPDGHFGAVVSHGVLETLERPDLALLEWRRVADKVFVVVPPMWMPHVWLDPSRRWYIDPSLKTAWPVWTDKSQVYLLPASDMKYRTPQWAQKRALPRAAQTSSTPLRGAPLSGRPKQEPASPTLPSPPSESSGSVSTLMVVSTGRSRSS